MSASDQIKAAIAIADEFRRDGHELKKAGTRLVCLCPFHSERTPSCHISTDTGRFHCFGCGEGGSVIDYHALTRKISAAEAIKELSARIRNGGANREPVLPTREVVAAKARTLRPMRLGDLQIGTRSDFAQLSVARNISLPALELASSRGFLRFFNRMGHRAWVITDRTRRNAQARRCDGASWQHIGGKKAWTLPGYKAAWPIGIEEAQRCECIALVEGGPDFLAAFHFLLVELRENFVAPVAMLGSSNRIPEDVLPMFSGKRLRIFPHADGAQRNHAGLKAAARWEAQLLPIAAAVDAFDFTELVQIGGQPVKDLNDLTNVDYDCSESERETWSMMNF